MLQVFWHSIGMRSVKNSKLSCGSLVAIPISISYFAPLVRFEPPVRQLSSQRNDELLVLVGMDDSLGLRPAFEEGRKVR